MEGYDSQPSLDGVREQEAPRGVDLVILLLDVLGNLLQDLQARTGKRLLLISFHFPWILTLHKRTHTHTHEDKTNSRHVRELNV